jgi:hypothetical protein
MNKQQIADEMTRLLVDDDTSDLDAVKAQAIRNLQGDKTMITLLQPTISTTGIRKILDNEGREIATVSSLLDGVDNAARAKESEYIHNEICNRFNKLAAAEKRIAELEAGIREIDETLRGELPITRIVKDIARRLLDGVK